MLTAEMMICPHSAHFMKLVYGTPICQALDKRSTDGSQGGSEGEIAGLVVGVIGVLLTALTVFKGWECWKLRRVSNKISVDESRTYSFSRLGSKGFGCHAG